MASGKWRGAAAAAAAAGAGCEMGQQAASLGRQLGGECTQIATAASIELRFLHAYRQSYSLTHTHTHTYIDTKM